MKNILNLRYIKMYEKPNIKCMKNILNLKCMKTHFELKMFEKHSEPSMYRKHSEPKNVLETF